MKQPLFCLLITMLLVACETKQWNLNKTIGWGEQKDFSVLLIKWQNSTFEKDSVYTNRKRELEYSISEVLKDNMLGDVGERDSGDVNTLFIAPKDNARVLDVIVHLLDSSDLQGKLKVYERKYESYNKWMDKAVHPK